MSKRKIAVVDLETDPFVYGRVPVPFALEFYSDEETFVHWGSDCIEAFAEFLEETPHEYDIYAHNGGRFDFLYMTQLFDGKSIMVVNGRLLKIAAGKHRLIDSWAILPFPLKSTNKTDKSWAEFDYAIMEADVRDEHRGPILEYLHKDCLQLYTLVTQFRVTLGDKLTIGGTAIAKLNEHVKWEPLNARQDAYFRQYYFGGRVECFASGVLDGPFKCFDVNSEYPFVMKTFNHPLGNRFSMSDELPTDRAIPWFAKVHARNEHALISRDEEGAITFQVSDGEFWLCAHEYWMAVDHGMIEIDEVLECLVPAEYGNFASFVDYYYGKRMEAAAAGDELLKLFWKLVLNSAYGKFGTNVANFKDYRFDWHEMTWEEAEVDGWELSVDTEKYRIWERPTKRPTGFLNVATAASITSAARATLLEGLNHAIDPIYCDTDSIICRDFTGHVGKSELGAWKHEMTADYCAIAGRKMYTLYNGSHADPKPQKTATKGVRLTAAEIIQVAEGGCVDYVSPVPTFSILDGNSPPFLRRKIRSTAKNVSRFRGE